MDKKEQANPVKEAVAVKTTVGVQKKTAYVDAVREVLSPSSVIRVAVGRVEIAKNRHGLSVVVKKRLRD